MPHQFLLHLHRGSGLVQPRTVRVAERVPTDFSELPSGELSWLVDLNPLPIRGGLPLNAPHPLRCTARGTRDQAASGRAKMPLLDLGRVVRTVGHRVCEHPTLFRGYGLLDPIQNDL